MSKETKKGIFQGIIEKDEQGNYFCGPYLLDYQYTQANFQLGDKVSIKTAVANPSAKSKQKYPKKSLKFFLAQEN
ncbi:hypothetical protein [Myroides sp. LJL119]